MFSVLHLSRVLKKLQIGDIAKFLILQTPERISGTSLVEFQRFCHRQKSIEIVVPACGSQASSDSEFCSTSADLSGSEVKLSERECLNRKISNKMSSDIVPNSQKDTVQNESQDTDASIPSGSPCFNSSLADIVKFLELVGTLKHTKRTGWVLRDVKDCESISGHMYRMSMMTFLLDGTEGLNRTKCMELALVHDLAESLVGDITPFCGISKEEKKLREINAMADICKLIEPRGKRIMELFMEYEENVSPESKFVKDLDRLDMVLQAFEYEKRDKCVMKHQEFFDSTDGKFDHPFVLKLVNEIHAQRQALADKHCVGNGTHNGFAEDDQNQPDNSDVSDLSHKKASTS